MRLRNIRVKGFRCVRDSGLIAIKDVAALIGRNESGKTSILQSLLLLNKDSGIVDVDMTDGLEVEMDETGFKVVEGKFELSKEESRTIADLGEGFPQLSALVIYRTSKSEQPKYDFGGLSFPPIFKFQQESLVPFKTIITSIATTLRQKIKMLNDAPKTEAPAEAIAKDKLILELEVIARSFEELANAKQPSRPDIDSFITKLDFHQTDAAVKAALGNAKELLENAAKTLYTQHDGRAEVEKLIQTKLHPRFVYFSSYKTIHGAIRLSEYLAAPGKVLAEKLDSGESLDKRETIDNLFFLGGLDPKHLDTLKTKIAAKNKYLLQCSEKLTDEIQKTWIREDGTRVFCEFQYGDDVVTIRVSDIHGETPRSARSPASASRQ